MVEASINYLPILIFFVVAAGLSVALVAASYLVSTGNPYGEKLSAYECGFEAFDASRSKFDVRFYLVAILFTIFDLEIAFTFPWAISLFEMNSFTFYSMMAFFGVLSIGFIYEWRSGALDWD